MKEFLSGRGRQGAPEGSWLERVYFGLTSLEAVDAISSTVDFVNELQIHSSSRFLYSSTRDFSFAERVLRGAPEVKDVRSLYRVGEMGMPPPAKHDFPPGEYLVVYGASSHHMLAIKDLSNEAEYPGIQFSTPDLEMLRAIQQDAPYESVSVYRGGQAIMLMRDAEFEDVDYTGKSPVRVKHRNDLLNQILIETSKRNK